MRKTLTSSLDRNAYVAIRCGFASQLLVSVGYCDGARCCLRPRRPGGYIWWGLQEYVHLLVSLSEVGCSPYGGAAIHGMAHDSKQLANRPDDDLNLEFHVLCGH